MRAITVRMGLAAITALALIVLPGPARAQPAPAADPASAPTPQPSSQPPVGDPSAVPSLPPGPGPVQAPEPGLFDVSSRVREAINDWFRELVESALNPALDLLGQTVLATPQVTGPGRVAELWGLSAGVANTFYVLLVLAGGVVMMSHETLQTRYSVKEIAPRAVIGMVASNTSLLLSGQAIATANALSGALLGQGVDPATATATMRDLVLAAIATGGNVLILIGLVAAVLALVLVAVYVVRVALVVLLVVGAPLALACHALPHTEGLAYLWWKAITACLGVQVAQSLVLITALQVFFDTAWRPTLGLPTTGGLVDLLVVACLLWILLRIPFWAGRMVFTGRSSVARTVKYYVTARVLGKGLGLR